MDIVLNQPFALPVIPAVANTIVRVRLLASNYDFQANSITVTWNIIDPNGVLLGSNGVTFTPEQTAAFFATTLTAGSTLLAAFQQAFLAAITSVYGAGSIDPATINAST